MKWSEMGRKKRRVAVAKDCIKQIQLDNLEVGGGYLGGPDWNLYDKEGEDFTKKDAKELMKNCTPCARGCLMLTKVAKFNHAKIPSDLDTPEASTETLADCFSQRQLELIESAFEGCAFGHVDDWDADVFPDWPEKWAENIPDKSKRFMAICQNIIDNGGDFEPKDFYEF